MIDKKIISLLTADGFDKRFFELASETNLEIEYENYFGKRKYSDYNSYRNCRDKRLKKAKK